MFSMRETLSCDFLYPKEKWNSCNSFCLLNSLLMTLFGLQTLLLYFHFEFYPLVLENKLLYLFQIYLLVIWNLNSILSHMKIVTFAFSLHVFTWKTFAHPSIFPSELLYFRCLLFYTTELGITFY